MSEVPLCAFSDKRGTMHAFSYQRGTPVRIAVVQNFQLCPTKSGIVIVSFKAGSPYTISVHLRFNVIHDEPSLPST